MRSLSYKRTSQYDTLTLFRAHNFTQKINKTKFHLIILVFLCFLCFWTTFYWIFLILKWIIANTQITDKYFWCSIQKNFYCDQLCSLRFPEILEEKQTYLVSVKCLDQKCLVLPWNFSNQTNFHFWRIFDASKFPMHKLEGYFSVF